MKAIHWDSASQGLSFEYRDIPAHLQAQAEEARAYIDRDGNPRGSLEVTANNIKFIGGRGDSAMPAAAPAGGQAEHAEASDEDIPF